MNEEYGYRLRYPKSWKILDWPGSLYLCSPRIKFPCGPTPHEVYATVAVDIRDPEGLELSDYLQSPARGYKKLREVQIGGVKAFATGPVGGNFGRFIDGRFISCVEERSTFQSSELYSVARMKGIAATHGITTLITSFLPIEC